MEFNEREKLIFLYASITSKLKCLDIHLSCHRNDNLDFDYVRETIKDLSETSPGAFLDILWPSAEKKEEKSIEVIEIYNKVNDDSFMDILEKSKTINNE